MLKKLRIKFVVYSMSIVLVMLGVILGLICHFTYKGLETQARQLMQQILNEPLLPPEGQRPEPRPNAPHLPYFVLELDAQGEIIASAGGYYDLSDRELLEDVLEQAMDSGLSEGRLGDYSLRFARGQSPLGQKIVFVDCSSEYAAMRSLGWTILFIGAAALLAFFALSWLLAHFATKPVERAWRQQRQFVADASHELKTPLTVITTSAELLGSCGEDERSRLSDSILDMSRRMRGLVEALLELARADDGAAKLDFCRLDFSALVSDELLPFEPLFFEAGLELQAHIAPGLELQGSADKLRRLPSILLDNALKYSSPGGMVRLSLQRQGGHCLLCVASPGQELSRQELKDIFKRFYRSDKVRSLGGGYGLGLSIARGIVSAHKGRIWAESGNGENRFFVSLPLG